VVNIGEAKTTFMGNLMGNPINVSVKGQIRIKENLAMTWSILISKPYKTTQ